MEKKTKQKNLQQQVLHNKSDSNDKEKTTATATMAMKKWG